MEGLYSEKLERENLPDKWRAYVQIVTLEMTHKSEKKERKSLHAQIITIRRLYKSLTPNPADYCLQVSM